jgi:ribosomal protein S18 acetylase RimI-like enzyme
MAALRVIDVSDQPSFDRIPPCADPSFDHRTCDYWENATGGSKASRPAWLTVDVPLATRPDLEGNPFAPTSRAPVADWLRGDDEEPAFNPFAPQRTVERPLSEGVPRKLALLDRGRGVFGSYAKVLLADDAPAGYTQFGPLSAYPRAQRLRELYPQLPVSPLPAVITCIATTREARRQGHAKLLVEAVCDDLTERGFSAVEVYSAWGEPPDATSTATPDFWKGIGFELVVDDPRYPVLRREL